MTRRRAQMRLIDIPKLLVGGAVQLAGLFGGRYRRLEGAHILVHDHDGRILVVRTTYLGPGWMLPGGRVERGETPEAAAVRETREETGLDVRVDRLLAVEAYRPRDVSFVFGGRVAGGDLAPQLGEIAEVAWLHRADVAGASRRLHRLLGLIEVGGDPVAYRGPDGSGEDAP